MFIRTVLVKMNIKLLGFEMDELFVNSWKWLTVFNSDYIQTPEVTAKSNVLTRFGDHYHRNIPSTLWTLLNYAILSNFLNFSFGKLPLS